MVIDKKFAFVNILIMLAQMFSKLTDFTRRFAYHRHAAPWLFFYSVIESVFFPVPPDVLLVPLALANRNKALFFALIAAIGSVTGGVVGYAIGYWAFDYIVPILNWSCKHFAETCPETFLPQLKALFAKHGVWVIAVSAISPIIPYRFCILAAGLGHMPLIPFIVISFLAHWLRYSLVSWTVAHYGPQAIGIATRRLPLTFAVIGAIILIIFLVKIYVLP